MSMASIPLCRCQLRLHARLKEAAQLIVGLLVLSCAASAATVDPAFAPVANGIVSTLAVQPDGKVLVGGSFTAIGVVPRAYLARLMPDGSLDTSFQTSLDGAVRVIRVQADGRLLIGGNFTLVDGTLRGPLARLHANGTLDTTFAPAIAGGGVGSLVLLQDGNVITGGEFTTVGGAPRPLIARLDSGGGVDTTFEPDLGPVTQLGTLAVTADGHVIASGSYTIRGFINLPVLIKLTHDGSRVSSFTSPLTVADTTPSVLLPNADGTVFAGTYGSFSSLLTIGADGAILAATKYGTGGSGFGGVSALARHRDGRLSIGGLFDTVFGGPTPHKNLVRTSLQLGLDSTYVVATDGPVLALALQANGGLLVAGDFAHVNGVRRCRAPPLGAAAHRAQPAVCGGPVVRRRGAVRIIAPP
jgi:uncharacterized delta-60 repeat protein